MSNDLQEEFKGKEGKLVDLILENGLGLRWTKGDTMETAPLGSSNFVDTKGLNLEGETRKVTTEGIIIEGKVYGFEGTYKANIPYNTIANYHFKNE